jgi:hypothetical protein
LLPLIENFLKTKTYEANNVRLSPNPFCSPLAARLIAPERGDSTPQPGYFGRLAQTALDLSPRPKTNTLTHFQGNGYCSRL